MSRSTVAKSRAEKAGKSNTSAPTPAITQEIIPGKFNDHDWNQMLEGDESEDFIHDIINNVVQVTMDTIYGNYIKKQLIPFTVSQAKDAILQIIEWRFLSRDEGEIDIQTADEWCQDEEPEPCETDCWAQGSVPCQFVSPSPVQSQGILGEITEELPEVEDSTVDTASSIVGNIDSQAYTESANLSKEENISISVEKPSASEKSVKQDLPKQQEKRHPETGQLSGDVAKEKNSAATRSRKFQPYKGKMNYDSLTRITTSLDDFERELVKQETEETPIESPDTAALVMPTSCHSILKLQAGRPPGNRDVFYDEQGNVRAVAKIPKEQLPNHIVKTKYKVIDPEVEAATSRLEAMRRGRYFKERKPSKSTEQNDIITEPAKILQQSALASNSYGSQNQKEKYKENYKESYTPLPPPLIESMDVSPGVTVKEGDRTKKGPAKMSRKMELMAAVNQGKLRPISIKARQPCVNVNEILEVTAPIVKPFKSVNPVPPISPKHGQLIS